MCNNKLNVVMNLQQKQISCNIKLKSVMEMEFFFIPLPPYIKRGSILFKITSLSFTLFIFFAHHREATYFSSHLFHFFSPHLLYFILILYWVRFYSFKSNLLVLILGNYREVPAVSWVTCAINYGRIVITHTSGSQFFSCFKSYFTTIVRTYG